ncbi:cysteine--tRNA ligase [Acidiphilium sp. AL]|uniref:Cysteine--tRNA ligase n=1 Tax=Acidiphilium iwatense TaxID=768198 RepID=A0ABS9DVD5_9PROT|nr:MULTISPECIES: cysteine--tRNA ligase [Acidiphilium]MCF3946659.1 cysteine--tRNA ligase [Acidiphilium iwatense]MCU4159984.1 cysteine--tRNA ligase [Acidiphilium sp. AL]
MIEIRLHNTKSRRREAFVPIDPGHVKLYVCGPTVYDHVHIGNARPVVVFDVLVRLLRQVFPRVTYVRNITDIDDKINAKSRETGEAIASITARTTEWYHRDMAALFALPPDIEPRATGHIVEIVAIIERLIERGHAYEAEGHVLFAVKSDAEYGAFSGRSPDELLAGARVDVAPYKRDPGDFVLWKPSTGELPGWDSPWGRGRPGWHIECSAMSWKHLGESFDIHGGGDDLIFPHHENEIAQSTCAFPGSGFARYWLHNRMLLVNGEKMSKSLGNFITVGQALERAPGEVIRFLLLKTHYRSTLDFTDAALLEAKRELDRFYRALAAHCDWAVANTVPDSVLLPLADDLNTPGAIAALHTLADAALAGDRNAASSLKAAGAILGVFNHRPADWFRGDDADTARIEAAIAERIAARRARDFTRADAIRAELADSGIILEDSPAGTSWRRA